MEKFINLIRKSGFKGELANDDETIEFYSHDASLFEIKPELVATPKNSSDLQVLVKLAKANKSNLPNLSITGRSAGTCMSGGAVNESIIVDFQHFDEVHEVTKNHAWSQPGVFYRDFDMATKKLDVIMPTY